MNTGQPALTRSLDWAGCASSCPSCVGGALGCHLQGGIPHSGSTTRGRPCAQGRRPPLTPAQVCLPGVPTKSRPPEVGACVDDGDPPGAAGALTSACSRVTNGPSPTVLTDVCVPTTPIPGRPAGASSLAPGAAGRLLKPHPHQPQVNPSAAHWQRRAPGPQVQSRTGTHDKAATHPGPSRRQGGWKLLSRSFRLKTPQNIKRVSALWRCLFRR